jgi:peroxidase
LSLLCSTAYGGQLTPTFYALSCPTLELIVRTTMIKAIIADRRMGASLLRLFFHDCFVQAGLLTLIIKHIARKKHMLLASRR